MLRQILYFTAMVETGSFSSTADKCCISQSAIPHQAKALEDKLLQKQERSFVVKETGQYFCQHGKKLVKQAGVLVWPPIRKKHKRFPANCKEKLPSGLDRFV